MRPTVRFGHLEQSNPKSVHVAGEMPAEEDIIPPRSQLQVLTALLQQPLLARLDPRGQDGLRPGPKTFPRAARLKRAFPVQLGVAKALSPLLPRHATRQSRDFSDDRSLPTGRPVRSRANVADLVVSQEVQAVRRTTPMVVAEMLDTLFRQILFRFHVDKSDASQHRICDEAIQVDPNPDLVLFFSRNHRYPPWLDLNFCPAGHGKFCAADESSLAPFSAALSTVRGSILGTILFQPKWAEPDFLRWATPDLEQRDARTVAAARGITDVARGLNPNSRTVDPVPSKREGRQSTAARANAGSPHPESRP